MLINYFFILASLTLSEIYADSLILSPNDYSVQVDDNNIHEGSLCEDKMKVVLSDMRSEIDMKLDMVEKNIPEMLEETIIRKMYTLENKIIDRLEEYLDRKFYKLERKMVEKLEEYMEDKKNSVTVSPPLKNNTQNIINDKIDVLNSNINVLINRTSDITKITTQLKILVNKTTETNCNKNSSDKTISVQNTSLQNDTEPYCAALNKAIHEVEKNISQKLEALKNAIPNLEKNITHKLDVLNGKIPDELDEKLYKELNAIKDVNLTEFKHEAKNNERWNLIESLTMKIKQGWDNKFDAMQKQIPNLEGNINKKFDVLQNIMAEKIFPRIQNVSQMLLKNNNYLECKELMVQGYKYRKPFFRIDSESFNHVLLKRTKNGQLDHFEMHIAIKAAKDGLILLSPVPDPGEYDRVFEIGVGIAGNQQTDLRLYKMRTGIGYTSTPDILSATRYQPFYVRIADGKIQFGKEGEAPIISYSDTLVHSVKYLSFASWDNREAKILFDCPELH